jgi:hypothetical protein
MSLTRLECQVSELANRVTRARVPQQALSWSKVEELCLGRTLYGAPAAAAG